MRRRRKTKYNWFPILGRGVAAVGKTRPSFAGEIALDLATQDDAAVAFWPVVENAVPDFQSENLYPLNDIIGNEYILKRIVGKVFCDYRLTVATGDLGVTTNLAKAAQVIAAAGFFVARYDPANVEAPVDFAQAQELYDPLNGSLAREPWIWRRTWMLGLGFQSSLFPTGADGGGTNLLVDGDYVQHWPNKNTDFPGVLDGPHIDAKTGRRVRQDEALFVAYSARYLSEAYNPVSEKATAQVRFTHDVRCLGALRRARNRSNF